MKITLSENKIGHILIVSSNGKDYYAQNQSDIQWIESNLYPEEIKDLHAGWDITIERDEPRFSNFYDLIYVEDEV